MDNKAIEKVQKQYYHSLHYALNIIRAKTAENPLVLYNPLKEEDEEGFYDLPYGYYFGKYEQYNEGYVQSVHGNNVVLALDGENRGQTHEMDLEELPAGSIIELLTYLKTT